jgi:predicted  nucleic acid-binding Zn-ribbon protein
MAKPAGITQDDIIRTAEALDADGKKPTMALIRDQIGGSFSTIGPVLKEWKESRKVVAAVVLDVPPELQIISDRQAAEYWSAASALATEKYNVMETEIKATLGDAETERDEYKQEVTRLESALETSNQERAKVEAEKQLSNDQIGELKAGTIRFEERLSASQRESSQLRENLARMTAEKDRHEDEASRLVGVVGELKRESNEYQIKLEKQHQKNTALSTLNGSLNDQLEQVKSEMEALKESNSRQADESLKLKTTVSGLEARIDDRNIKIKQLETTNTGLKDEAKKAVTLEAELKACKSRSLELTQEASELKQENKVLHGDVGKLKGELKAVKK